MGHWPAGHGPVGLTIHGEGCSRHVHNRRGVLAGLPLALALAAEQQEGKAAFLGYRIGDVT